MIQGIGLPDIPEPVANLLSPGEDVIWTGKPLPVPPHSVAIWRYLSAGSAVLLLVLVGRLIHSGAPVRPGLDVRSTLLVVSLVGFAIFAMYWGASWNESDRRIRTTYVLSNHYGYAYEEGINAEPSRWKIHSDARKPILVKETASSWALLFLWRASSNSGYDPNPSHIVFDTVWGEGFHYLPPDERFLSLVERIGVRGLDPRELVDPDAS